MTLFQLRGNRAPFLRSTRHLWGREESPACPHCGAEREDTEHFIVHCPRWARERHTHLGHSPDISSLHNDVHGALRFVEATGVATRPPYAP